MVVVVTKSGTMTMPSLTLKMALSLRSLSGRFFLGSSRVVCSSSFQSLDEQG